MTVSPVGVAQPGQHSSEAGPDLQFAGGLLALGTSVSAMLDGFEKRKVRMFFPIFEGAVDLPGLRVSQVNKSIPRNSKRT